MAVTGTSQGILTVVVVVVGLLGMAQQSQEMSFEKAAAYGIIVTSTTAEKALNDSASFHPSSYLHLSGRRFVSGTIFGANVVYVRSAATPSVHVGITAQIMAYNFNLRGIIYFGSAGTTNETISVGSVVVPALFAFTGAFKWLRKDGNEQQGQLVMGEYNYPVNGQNILGSFMYEEIEEYVAGQVQHSSWIPADPYWLFIASKIKEVDFPNCETPSSNCLGEAAKVIVGLNGSSSDMYINNPAYREFLYNTFRASTVDTSGAAIALGALANDLPFVVFQGISNKAGAGSESGNTTLANQNALKALLRFIWLANVPRSPY